MKAIERPMLAELVECLRDAQGWIEPDQAIPGEEPSIDVRIQCEDGGWRFHQGDASYDQSHLGHWGSSGVTLDMDDAALESVARSMLEQVEESIALEESVVATEGGAS